MDWGIFMKADYKLLAALEGLKRGEKKGFEVLYSQTYHFVYARARHAMPDEQEALALVKEVYLTAYRNIGSLKDSICLYSWLGSIIVRQGAKMENKNGNQNLLSHGQESMFEEMEDLSVKVQEKAITQENAKLLKNIIEKLPEPQKTVIIEYYYDGVKVNEIADLTETSKETVMSRLYLARKRLREMIEEQKTLEGFALCGFNTPLMIWAVGILLEDTRMNKEEILEVYQTICEKLGISCVSISFGEAGKSLSMERIVGEQVRRKKGGKKDCKIRFKG